MSCFKTSFTYDGKAKKPAVTVKDATGKAIAASNYTVAYANNGKAGKATATVAFKGPLYKGSKALTFTIAKATIAVPKAKAGLVYSGKSQAGVKAGAGYAVKGGSATKAGSYTATLTADANHQFPGGKATASVKWSIAKAANPLKVEGKKAAVGFSKSKDQALKADKVVSFKKKGQGALAYKKAKGSKKISIAKGGKVTVKAGLKAGTYKVTAKVKAAGNANYKASSWKKFTFKVTVK